MGSATDDSKPINVAIIGGGIGGLALSIGLQQYSHIKVRIFEAAPQFFDIGGGVFFGANAIRAMSLIDPAIGEAYARISTTAGWASKEDTYFDIVLGQDLRGQPAGTAVCSPRLGPHERHSTAHRARFIDELANLVPEEAAEFGKRLVDLTRDEARDRTLMRFADGVSYEADAVIGCDGIRSVCRSFVLGKDNPLTQPVFTGKYAYRGRVPMDRAIAAIGEEKARNRYMFLGKGGHVLTFPVAKGRFMNVLAFGTSKDGNWEGNWIKLMKKEDLEEDFRNFGPDCQKIFSLLENTDQRGIFDLSQDIPTFTSEPLRLLLLGDSAHACAPHQGADAGQALEDAHILSHMLGACRSKQDLLPAFAAYESVRRPRTRFVQHHGRRQGELLDLLHWSGVEDDDLDKLREAIDGSIREIWNCDLEAELAKAQARMREHRPVAYQLSAIQKAIPAPLWPDFCALHLATQYFGGPDRSTVPATDLGEVKTFLDQHFHGALPTDLPIWQGSFKLARGLVHKIEWFVKDFTETVGAEARSLQQMYRPRVQNRVNGPTDDDEPSSSTEFGLSAPERLRLYRAFIQFELSCVLFHPSPTRSRIHGRYSGKDQHNLFFSNLEIWEVEAIACIHQYLTRFIRAACDGLDGKFESFARSLEPEPRLKHLALQSCASPWTLADLSVLQFGSFHHFSTAFRKIDDHGEGAKISAGLGFMLEFARGDQMKQLKLLRKYTVKHDSLYTAIDFLRQDQALCTLTEPSTDDGTEASAGYVKHYASAVGHSEDDQAVYFPMRALGCVFWDSERLESGLFTDTRRCVRVLDQEQGYDWATDRYTRKNRPSPEQALQNVYIPWLQGHGLRKHFGLDDGSSLNLLPRLGW
ncbi:hypothetical protein MY4038_000702 [Beauveria bassiana]